MFNFGDVLGPGGGGLDPSPKTALITKRGGDGVRGDLVALDLPNNDDDVSNNRIGDANSGLRNVVVPTSSDYRWGQLAVLKDNISDNKTGTGIFEGECWAYVTKASGNISKGDPLYATVVSGVGVLTADATVGSKIVARAIEGATAPSTKQLKRVAFSGVHALGVHYAS